jgi:hypothetical protein
MPPLQALAALHGFWIMVVLVPTVVALRRWSPDRLRRVGAAVMLVGLAALVLATAADVSLWLAESPPEFRLFVPQRILFFLATLTQFPLFQVTAAGAVWWWVGRRGVCRL